MLGTGSPNNVPTKTLRGTNLFDSFLRTGFPNLLRHQMIDLALTKLAVLLVRPGMGLVIPKSQSEPTDSLAGMF